MPGPQIVSQEELLSDPQYLRIQALADFVNAFLNTDHSGSPGTCYMLFTLPFGDDHPTIDYISNGRRPECIAALREWLTQMEAESKGGTSDAV